MWRKFIENTRMFFIILLFVKVFEVIFGSNNSLVGVSILIAILILKYEDLTENFWGNLFKILFVNVVSGIFTYLATNNIYLGIALNFLALFTITYMFTSKMNKMMVIPFGLQYLFMLYSPVVGYDFIKRLIELGVGAILVMIVQLITYRNSNKNKEENKIGLNNDNVNKYNIKYKFINIYNDFKVNDVRMAYSIRIAIITTIAIFIVGFFNLANGRWLVYTVFSLTELYSEQCRSKSKQRLQGTMIGGAIIILLFMFIKDSAIRGLIVLLAGYLDSYTTNYRDKVICITMAVVASISLAGNITVFIAVERLIYVALGIILAIFADKFIFNSKLESK